MWNYMPRFMIAGTVGGTKSADRDANADRMYVYPLSSNFSMDHLRGANVLGDQSLDEVSPEKNRALRLLRKRLINNSFIIAHARQGFRPSHDASFMSTA